MVKEFLKIAGVKTEAQFYKKYPSEEAFFRAHPEARQLLHQKMAYGGEGGPGDPPGYVPGKPYVMPRAGSDNTRVSKVYPVDRAAAYKQKHPNDYYGYNPLSQAELSALAHQTTGNPGNNYYRVPAENIRDEYTGKVMYSKDQPGMLTQREKEQLAEYKKNSPIWEKVWQNVPNFLGDYGASSLPKNSRLRSGDRYLDFTGREAEDDMNEAKWKTKMSNQGYAYGGMYSYAPGGPILPGTLSKALAEQQYAESHPVGADGIPELLRAPVQQATAPVAAAQQRFALNPYQGVSVYDMLQAQGKAGDLQSRKALAKTLGISNYKGTSTQNAQMMDMIRQNPDVLLKYTGVSAPIASSKSSGSKKSKQGYQPTKAELDAYMAEENARQAKQNPYIMAPGAAPIAPPINPFPSAGRGPVKKYSKKSDEYIANDPYFFADEGDNGFIKLIDAPFTYARNQGAKIVLDGDLLTAAKVAAMGAGAGLLGRAYDYFKPGYEPYNPNQLPASSARVPGQKALPGKQQMKQLPPSQPRGWTMKEGTYRSPNYPFRHGGAYGNVPQHGRPGTYADGSSGTFNGGQSFSFGGDILRGFSEGMRDGSLPGLAGAVANMGPTMGMSGGITSPIKSLNDKSSNLKSDLSNYLSGAGSNIDAKAIQDIVNKYQAGGSYNPTSVNYGNMLPQFGMGYDVPTAMYGGGMAKGGQAADTCYDENGNPVPCPYVPLNNAELSALAHQYRGKNLDEKYKRWYPELGATPDAGAPDAGFHKAAYANLTPREKKQLSKYMDSSNIFEKMYQAMPNIFGKLGEGEIPQSSFRLKSRQNSSPEHLKYLADEYGYAMGGTPCYNCGGMYEDGGSPLYSTQGQSLRNFMNTVAYGRGGNQSMYNIQFPEVGPRYQEGGMAPEEQAMMAQQQAPPQQGGGMDPQQIMQEVAQMLQQGAQPDQIMQQLVQEGVPEQMAQQIIQQVMQQMQGAPQAQPGMKMGGSYKVGSEHDMSSNDIQKLIAQGYKIQYI